jgi:hypothetical protein
MRFVAAFCLLSLGSLSAQPASPEQLTVPRTAWAISWPLLWAQIGPRPGSMSVPGVTTPMVAPQKAARVPSQTISELEHSFDHRLETMADADNPVDLLGGTRGIQLEDFGMVFTTEASLLVTPTLTPFRQTITPELAARVHKTRIERMPLLKAAMKEMMRNMATACIQVPFNQQLVLAVRLYYGAWEDMSGMPAQIIMKADRASAALGKIETEER